MKKSRFQSPYKANGRTNFPKTRKKSGVYIIKKNGKIVYVGHSKSNLYKTMYRHFQDWNDSSQIRVSYASQLNKKRYDFKVRVVLTSPARAERLERALILKHKPKDNPLKISKYSLTKQEQKSLSKAAKEYVGAPVDNVPF